MQGYAALTVEERALVEGEIAALPRIIEPMIRAVTQDYRAVRRRATETMPRALFVLIPALAFFLSLLYRGRHLPDHLYFVIHVQTFAFLALTAASPIEYTRSVPVMAPAQFGGLIWIGVYALIAMRRAYGGSWPATGLKATGILVLYGSLWSAVVVVVTIWAVAAPVKRLLTAINGC